MAFAEVIRGLLCLAWTLPGTLLPTFWKQPTNYTYMCVCSRIFLHSSRESIISVSHLEFPSLAGSFLYQLTAFSISFATDKVTLCSVAYLRCVEVIYRKLLPFNVACVDFYGEWPSGYCLSDLRVSLLGAVGILSRSVQHYFFLNTWSFCLQCLVLWSSYNYFAHQSCIIIC